MCSFQGDTWKWKDQHIWYSAKYLAGNLYLEYQLLEVLEMERWVSGYYFESLNWVFCASYTLSFNWKPFGPLLIATKVEWGTTLLPPLLTY